MEDSTACKINSRKKYLIAGCGVSGTGAARLLAACQEQAILYDGNADLDTEKVRENLGEAKDFPIVTGELPCDVLSQIHTCVISPGIALDSPLARQLENAGIPIWSEIELAWRHGQGKVAAVTGTNGKTTTTALIGEILAKQYPDVHVAGNIGTSYTGTVLSLTEESVTALELSSFQLESIVTFHPQVSAILNITPDHLNRHKTMEEYVKIKKKITMNQTADDFCVLNYDDEILRDFGEKECVPAPVYFSSGSRVAGGVYLEDDGSIVSELDGDPSLVCRTDELSLLGRHNYENVMAAVAVCRKMGVPMELIREGCLGFHPVEHRIEFVREVNGAAYYNDSKGTNPDAAIRAVCAMTRPTILIGGGYDKGSDYTDWIASFPGHVKLLILLGETADKIERTARAMGFNEIRRVSGLEEAVRQAYEEALPGDAVLLSPACASWDMFSNYEERGRMFKEMVMQLPDDAPVDDKGI